MSPLKGRAINLVGVDESARHGGTRVVVEGVGAKSSLSQHRAVVSPGGVGIFIGARDEDDGEGVLVLRLAGEVVNTRGGGSVVLLGVLGGSREGGLDRAYTLVRHAPLVGSLVPEATEFVTRVAGDAVGSSRIIRRCSGAGVRKCRGLGSVPSWMRRGQQ